MKFVGELVVSGYDTSKLLQLVEKDIDAIALLVKFHVVVPLELRMGAMTTSEPVCKVLGA